MKKLISNIRENSKIIIDNKAYKVLAKAFYVTQSKPNDIYVKVFFKNHYVLVISPSDNFAYFGKNVGAIGPNFPTPTKLCHKSKKYRKVIQDYQIPVKLEFGSPVHTEGEVKFIDYENEKDKNLIISVGLSMKTNRRADIVAKVLNKKNIIIRSK